MIIFESLSSAKKKYLETGKISQEDFAGLLFVDKTPSKKHIEWICKMYLEDKNFDEIILGELLEEFEKRNKSLKEKDINKYQSISDLQNAILKAQETKIEKRIENLKTKPEIVFQNNKVIVYRPRTMEEAIDLGRGTKWCISSSKENPTTDVNFWNQYYDTELNTIYVIFNFTVNSSSTEYNKYKMAVVVNKHGNIDTLWDANDKSYTVTLPYLYSLGIPDTTFKVRDFYPEELCGIYEYETAEDGGLIVDGDVFLGDNFKKKIPIPFYSVRGDFNAQGCGLLTLQGSPKIVGASFNCMANSLTSLEYSPKHVGFNFYATYNKLESLRGCTEKIGGSFEISADNLTSLQYAPKEVLGDFFIFQNDNRFSEDDVRKVCNVHGKVVLKYI